jgi:hypothetical protein
VGWEVRLAAGDVHAFENVSKSDSDNVFEIREGGYLGEVGGGDVKRWKGMG